MGPKSKTIKRIIQATLVAITMGFGAIAQATTIYALGNARLFGGGTSDTTDARWHSDRLFTIDSTSGASSLVGTIGISNGNLRALAINPLTGKAYASGASLNPVTGGGNGAGGLYEINLGTGLATFVGGTLNMSDMVFDASGTLFGMQNRQGGTNRRFHSIDVTTGVETFLATNTLGTTGDLGALAYSLQDGQFFWSPRFTLRTVDPTTGVASSGIAISGGGIAFQTNMTASNSGQLFVVDRKDVGGLYTINKTTGNATLIGSTGLGVTSIAYAVSTIAAPEPATLGLLALGLAGIGFRRRKIP